MYDMYILIIYIFVYFANKMDIYKLYKYACYLVTLCRRVDTDPWRHP